MCILQSGETVIPLGDAPLVIGREAGGVFGDHPGMSRRHAIISRRPDGGYQIEDLNSRNGTYLNGVRVNGIAPLTHGDRLQITDFLFRFLPAATPAVPPGDQTVAGAHPGPDYLAPEQIDEELGPPSPATDLHAVAVMAFHMLTGELPYTATKQHLRSEAIAKRSFRSCATVCRQRQHDSSLAEIIDHCLNGRYALTHHLLRDLTDAVVVPAPPAVIAIGPALDEPLRVEGLLFEDKLGEAHAAIGSRNGGRVTLRLVKPSYDIPPLRPLFRGPFPPADAPPAIARCFHSGRAVPVPVGPGVEVVVGPAADGVGALAAVEEYLGVRTLAAAIAAGEFVGDDAAVARVLVPVVEALRYAHARRVVHGRLNPHCVFLTDRGPRIDGFAPIPDPPPPTSAPYPLGRYAATDGHWMNEGGEPHSASTITGSRLAEVRASDLAAPERLRLTLDLITRVAAATDPDVALQELAEQLLTMFRAADRCLVIQFDPAGRPYPRVVRARRPGTDDRFSRTIVRRCAETKEAILGEDANADAAAGGEWGGAEHHIRSFMCAPLVATDGRPLGVIQLDTPGAKDQFRTDDLKLLVMVAWLAVVTIEKAQVIAVLHAREKTQREIELARQVQLDFLPRKAPDVPGYEFFSFYSAAQAIGGDYFDYIPLPDGRLAILLGDVAGKGVPAAMLVAKVSAEARYCLRSEPRLDRAVSMLNDQLVRGGIGDRFVTLVAVILDPARHTFTLVSAGHQIPLRYGPGERTLALSVSDDVMGMPLGIMEGFEYQTAEGHIEPGETLVMFTDGVTDRVNQDGVLLEMDGVHAVASDPVVTGNPSPRVIGERLMAAVRTHAAGAPQNDDIALVCFGRTA